LLQNLSFYAIRFIKTGGGKPFFKSQFIAPERASMTRTADNYHGRSFSLKIDARTTLLHFIYIPSLYCGLRHE